MGEIVSVVMEMTGLAAVAVGIALGLDWIDHRGEPLAAIAARRLRIAVAFWFVLVAFGLLLLLLPPDISHPGLVLLVAVASAASAARSWRARRMAQR